MMVRRDGGSADKKSAKSLPDSVQSRLDHYLDPNAFSRPASYTFGNAPRTLPRARGQGLKNADVSMFISNPVLVRDTLFGLSHRNSGQFFGLDARTGKVLWLSRGREATNTAVVKAGELLFLLNDDAVLIVARSSQTGFEPLHRYTVADSATWAQPAISGNRVFIKDVSTLALWTLQ